MDNNLKFFNKEGDSLNFNYNEELERYEGKIFFDTNSSDTFKTQMLFLFEKIAPFQFSLNDGEDEQLFLDKFQLFNEWGFDFNESKREDFKISGIVPTNNNSQFRSKWILGENIDGIFPKGTLIRFNQNISEFNNPSEIWTVVRVRVNGIMIISNTNNEDYSNLYNTDDLTGQNITISGLNAVSIRRYVDSNLLPNISDWSEPFFYDKLFEGRRFSIVGTDNNDGIYRVKSLPQDKINYKFITNINDIISNETFWSKITLKTNAPKIYNGTIVINNNILSITGNIPIVLKPGTEFRIGGSNINNNFYRVSNIAKFDYTPGVEYNIDDLRVFNNRIYKCVQSYTQETPPPQLESDGDSQNPWLIEDTDIIDPNDPAYWTLSDRIPVDNINSETLFSAQIYLTSNEFTFATDFDQTKRVTAFEFKEKFAEIFNFFDINLNIIKNNIEAELEWSSDWAEVEFFSDNTLISNTHIDNSKIIEVEERMTFELNRNISKRLDWSIRFNSLDSFGLNININGNNYRQDYIRIVENNVLNEEKSVDKTLRAWFDNHFLTLLRLGIICDLKWSGLTQNPLVNTIHFTSTYPNVPFDFKVNVGDLSEYLIERWTVNIGEIRDNFRLFINNIEYSVEFENSVEVTLENWIERHSRFLREIGIIVENVGKNIKIFSLDKNQMIDIRANVGEDKKPGERPWKLIKNWEENIGTIIASNSIRHQENVNFKDENFATGQIISINNSEFVYNNTEYNILYLDSDIIVLSYQGPFWGNFVDPDILSGFLGYAFDDGFGYDPDAINLTQSITGTFSETIIDSTYNQDLLTFYPLSEDVTTIGFEDLNKYNWDWTFIENISLTQSQSVKSLINPNDGNIYNLKEDYLIIYDPISEDVQTHLLSDISHDIEFHNNDIFISYVNNNIENFTQNSTISGSWTQNDFNLTSSDNILFGVNSNNILYDLTNDTLIGTAFDKTFWFNNHLWGFDGNELFSINTNNFNIETYSIINNNITQVNFTYDPERESVWISGDNGWLYSISIEEGIIYQEDIEDFGKLKWDNYDNSVYLMSEDISSLSDILILSLDNNITQVSLTEQLKDFTFNTKNNSLIGINLNGHLIEVKINTPRGIRSFSIEESLQQDFDNSISIEDGQFGTLAKNFQESDFLLISSREYLRRPRENFQSRDDVNVKYQWSWKDDQTPELFLYDFSGTQLEQDGPYAYTGDTPLPSVRLRRDPNRDLEKVGDPNAQQTIFDNISFTLDHIDSTENVDFTPESLNLFIGFNSRVEGVINNNLILTKIEDIETSFNINNNIDTKINLIKNDNDFKIKLEENSPETFFRDINNNRRNLKEGQIIQLRIRDLTSQEDQYISPNDKKRFKIKNVFIRELILEEIDMGVEEIIYDENIIFDFTIKVMPKVLGDFSVWGQTEIEDIRYKIELGNTGKLINPDDVYIFKEYDINEQGIDWEFLNRKRREMLLIRPEIYNYIGSYKSIINAINYFGYNELELFEYYRNVNRASDNFNKLVKIEIPDIFDNTKPGWEESAFVLNTFPNRNYEETNLFNLTFRITDKKGNNVLHFSLDEVLTKLMGLKDWLEKNIIPITHNILDITGQADFVGPKTIIHEQYEVEHLKINSTMTPVNFTVPEAYVLPVNSGSTQYNAVLRPQISSDENLPDSYFISIKTYQTHPQWEPFKSYNENDLVLWRGDIWKSLRDNNITKNPLEFENTATWSANIEYIFGQIVKYDDNIYQLIVDNLISSDNPFNNSNWEQINWWEKQKIQPVQIIKEWREINNLTDFNFTVDTNIDPFVIIELTSDNGYGQNYTVKKSVELKFDADSNLVLEI